VERDMSSAVNTEMQLYSISGSRGGSLKRVYNYSDVNRSATSVT